jgi:hypothetical protein
MTTSQRPVMPSINFDLGCVLMAPVHQRWGFPRKSAAISSALPAGNTVASSKALPMTCRPSGSPSLESRRHRDTRQAGEIERHREHVVRYIETGSAVFSPRRTPRRA